MTMKTSTPYRFILTIIVIACCWSASAVSQVRFRVGTGLSTQWITNDNAATYRMVPNDSLAPEGGSFDGMQFGWGLRAYADLDKQKTFRVPLGFDYTSYSGAQSWATDFYSSLLKHTNQAYTILTGFEYSFMEFPLAFARVYSGVELRGTYFVDNLLQYRIEYFQTGVVQDITVKSKPDVFRVGAMARLGIEGEIYYPVFLNTSVAYGAVNFIGRDTRPVSEGGRGELLTTRSKNESAENLVWQLNFTFMIQVRL